MKFLYFSAKGTLQLLFYYGNATSKYQFFLFELDQNIMLQPQRHTKVAIISLILYFLKCQHLHGQISIQSHAATSSSQRLQHNLTLQSTTMSFSSHLPLFKLSSLYNQFKLPRQTQTSSENTLVQSSTMSNFQMYP